ncbi:sulfotransferase [Flavobacteriaceae bacterium]|nr:sulfotransferase [Flavobacteriaceae bacterium]
MFLENSKQHFIISCPRSGTTWLSKMLNTHKNIFCVERRLFGDYADFVFDEGIETPRLRITLDKYIKSVLLHHGLPKSHEFNLMKSFLSAIAKEERKFSGSKISIDKVTPYLNTSNDVLNQLSRFFPKSKIIFLVRDGRDVLTSGVFHWFNKKLEDKSLNKFEKIRISSFQDNQEFKSRRFFQDKEIVQWANHWVDVMKIIPKAALSHDIKIVYYKDLLKDTKKEISEIFDFLEIRKSNHFIDECVKAGSFKIMSNGRERGTEQFNNHIRKGVNDDWRNYFTYEDSKLFNDIAGEMLLKYNFIKNLNWYN